MRRRRAVVWAARPELVRAVGATVAADEAVGLVEPTRTAHPEGVAAGVTAS